MRRVLSGLLLSIVAFLAPVFGSAQQSASGRNIVLYIQIPPQSPHLSEGVFDFFGTVGNFTGGAFNISDLGFNFFAFDPNKVNSFAPLPNNDNFSIPNGTTSPLVTLFDLTLKSVDNPNATYQADVIISDPQGNFSNAVNVPLAQPQQSGFFPVPGILGEAFPRSAFQLVLHVPVANRGTVSASNVVITSAIANGQMTTSSLPVSLGPIVPGSAADLQLNFDRSYFPTGFKTTLTIKGTYIEGNSTYGLQMSIPFTVLDAGTPDGTTEVQPVEVLAHDPPCRGQNPYGFCPHGSAYPVDDDESGEPEVPEGPPRSVPSVLPSNIDVNFDSGGGGFMPKSASGPPADTDPLRFSLSRDFNDDIRFNKAPDVLDPSVARNNGDVVLASGNWYLGVSLTGGEPPDAESPGFVPLDPTTVFGTFPAERDFCCDQVVHYATSIDRFVYVSISRPPDAANAINDLRIAVARPADIQADRMADPPTNHAWQNGGIYTKDSNFLNIPNMWLDYPDVSISAGYLLVTGNIYQKVAGAGGQIEDQYRGYYTLIIRLVDLRNGPPFTWYLLFWNTPANDGTGERLTQDSSVNPHFASHINSSTLRVSEWDVLAKTWTMRNVGHASYVSLATSYTVAGGNQPQWLSCCKRSGILGATERFPSNGNPELWFAWTAGRGHGHPRPYIQIARIDRKTWTLLENKLIWNPDFAWAYPSLSTNSNQEVGMAEMTGAEDGIPNYGVSLLTGTFANDTDAGGAATKARWGDYLTIRRDPKNRKLFSATGYGVAGNPTDYRLWYSRFGRSSDVIAGP
jgi:hypothetical protein